MSPPELLDIADQLEAIDAIDMMRFCAHTIVAIMISRISLLRIYLIARFVPRRDRFRQ